MDAQSTSDSVAVNPPTPTPDPFDEGLDQIDIDAIDWGLVKVVPFQKPAKKAAPVAGKAQQGVKKVEKEKKDKVTTESRYADFMVRPTVRVGGIDPSGVGSDERLWEFVEDGLGSHWRVMPTVEADAFKWLRTTSPGDATARRAEACVKTAVRHLQSLKRVMPAADHRQPIIPILGAYLIVEPGTGVIRVKAPDPEDGMTHTVPARFDESRIDEEGFYHPRPVDPDSRFGAYLDRFFPSASARALLQEAVGSSLMAGCRERAWQLVGSGSNGKSTLLHILRALHPKTEAMDLSQLGEDKFALSKIIDATCVISTESTPNLGAHAEQKMKAIISRDPIQTRAGIGKDFITATPRCTLFIASNTPLSWSDQTYGMSSKIGIIPFLEKVKRGTSEVVLDYHLQITQVPEEMAQVLDWALEGAARVERQNGFSSAEETVKYADDVRRQTNPLYNWICDTELRISDRHETPKEAIYEHFVETVTSQGHRAMAASKFWPAVDAVLEERKEGKRRERQMKINGRKQPRLTNLKLSVVSIDGHVCDGTPHAWTPEAERVEGMSCEMDEDGFF